jgi:hypothetical protein
MLVQVRRDQLSELVRGQNNSKCNSDLSFYGAN